MDDSVSFDKRMRAATKEIHSISDALVNAKLAFALSNSEVWAEGLLVFYEVFRYLEEAVVRHTGTLVEDVFVEEMSRTDAFERDLGHYLGDDWKKTYTIRDSVASYLNHLRKIEKDNPNLLIAYIYHLYMGLASGGQILRYKRNMTKKLGLNPSDPTSGNCVTEFTSTSASSLKKRLRDKLNSVATRLSDEDKEKLIEESKTVFQLNNEIIRSVKSADQIFKRKIMLLIFVIIFIILIFLLIRG